MTKIYFSRLMDYMNELPIVDAHSHIFNDEASVAKPADVFTRIFSLYSVTSVRSAGFPAEKEEWLRDTSVSIIERWRVFKPFFEFCKENGYMQAAIKSAEGLYGISNINDDTVEELNERIKESNKAGLFDFVVREKCNIKCVINQQPGKGGLSGEYAPTICRDYMGLLPEPIIREGTHSQRGALKQMLKRSSKPISADDLARICAEDAARSHIGMKFVASFPQTVVSKDEADRYLALYLEDKASDEQIVELAFYLQDALVRECGKLGLVVCVHAALNYCCGLEYRCNDPQNIIRAARKYRKTKFDVYHTIPWMRQAAVMANQYPNIYLNLTWAHQISPYMVRNSLNEWLDLVPLNKIIGFGSDATNVEKVYGALCLTKENIAYALALRCEAGMSEEYARYICKRLLWDNPIELYSLDKRGALAK